MNRFLKKSAALVLTIVLLATGCSSQKATSDIDSSDTSAEISEYFVTSSDTVSSGSEMSDLSVTSSDTFSSSGVTGNPELSSDVSSTNSPNSSDSLSGGSTNNSQSGSTGGSGNNNSNSSTTGESSSGNGGSGSSNGNNNGGSVSGSSGGNSSSGNVSSGFSFDWSSGNSWEESGNKCGSVELTIKNNSGKAISSWKISFDVPNGFKITNGWNASYSVNGTKVTASNVEYNGSIPAGGSVGIGFNYSSPSAFTPPGSVSINGTTGTSSGNSGNNSSNNGGNSSGNSGNSGNGGNSGNTGSDKNQVDPAPSEEVAELLERSDKAVQGDDWLHTDGNRILDKNGKQVWLTGVNWFGYNTGTNTFDGLWNSQLRGSVKAIADHGFNLIRVPISAELINQWSNGEYPKANYNNAYNTELNDMNSLQIFDYFLKLAEENGIKVMPDIHCAETNAMGHNVNLWYTDKVSVDDYYHALEWLADRYKNNDTIIAIDIKNEPHGKPYEGSGAAIWNDSKDKNNWKYTAEQAAAKILAKNPNVLIMVEGTEIYSKNNGDYSSQNDADYYFNWWGGNLRGVRDYPVNLGKYQDKLVYSPHDYGPTVYEQPWFEGGFDYNSLIRDCWGDNWLYIQKENIAPLLIGEWGGYMEEPNLKWMTCMRKLISEYHLNHTFWCYNANSGDTGGLVLDDFTTWDTEKYNFVKEVLWQENGKFVGLDHAIPLGENGISLSSAKGL